MKMEMLRNDIEGEFFARKMFFLEDIQRCYEGNQEINVAKGIA